MDVVQPAGVEAVKLVLMVVQASQTVRHNKKTCQQLTHRTQMIGDLLKKLQSSGKMRLPEVRSPLEVLEEILREAYMLIKSCQKSNYMYQIMMGQKQADQLRVVQKRIDSYLLIFPLISQIDTADQMDQILNAIRPFQSQVAEEVPRLLSGCSSHHATSCSSGDARVEICGKFERVHAVNEPFTVNESNQAGSLQTISLTQTRLDKVPLAAFTRVDYIMDLMLP